MTTEHIPTGVADTAAAHIVRHVASTHTAEELTVVWSTRTTLCPDWSVGHDQTRLAADWHPAVYDTSGLGGWHLASGMQCGCGLRFGPPAVLVEGHVDPGPLAADIAAVVKASRDAQLGELVAELRAAIAAVDPADIADLADFDYASPREVARWDGDLAAWGVLPATGERVDVLADDVVVDEIEMVAP